MSTWKKNHCISILLKGRLWQKTCIEVVCCYVSHHPTVLSPLSRLQCDNQKLVYFLINSSCLYVLSCKFISCITLTFRFNLTSHAKYIVLCGVSHLVIYFIRGITWDWCFNSRITLVVDSNLLSHTLSFVASLFTFWRLGSTLVTKCVWYLRIFFITRCDTPHRTIYLAWLIRLNLKVSVIWEMNLRESTYRQDEFMRKYTNFWLSRVTQKMMGLTNKLAVTSEV